LFEYQEKTQALAVKAVEERAARGARAAPAKKTAACREGGSSGGEGGSSGGEGGSSGGEGQALWEVQGNEEVHARAHLQARAGAQVVQGVRRQQPLRAARAATRPMQGLRRQRHLRARAAAPQVQGLPLREGRCGRAGEGSGCTRGPHWRARRQRQRQRLRQRRSVASVPL
jgi:hypothetical protein